MIVPIYPPLDGVAAERFSPFARALQAAQLTWNRAELSRLLEAESAWAISGQIAGDQKLVYEACIRVLADLARLRWRIIEQGYGFALENPKEPRRGLNPRELVAIKSILRQQMEPIVSEQLEQPAVKDFKRRMESDYRSKRTIRAIVADPDELFARVALAKSLRGEARVDALAQAVQPYLQRVGDVADHVTGRSLREIWRYFRYSWSIPQVAIPGRQLLYLVRDAGHPAHPVMGIASLNNCPLKMGETRETYIGWHRNAVAERFERAAAIGEPALRREMEWLEERIASSLAEIEWANLLDPAEATSPTDDVIARLNRRAQGFAQLREELLKADGIMITNDGRQHAASDVPPVDDAVLHLEMKASVGRMHEARRHLIAKKRASGLARLLTARLVLARERHRLVDPSAAMGALASEDVQNAINIAMEFLKGRRAGANMLEITTCGAVEPYGPLLAGKLVALLMLSPEVASNYRAMYGSPSIISSQMLNRPVVRDSSLVYLGTTSLYVHGSSQYNRLKLPAGTIAPDQPVIDFARVGETSGYGTVQFSAETSKAIDALLRAKHAYREVNGVFGEGSSPKLRKMKTGLRLIGFDPDRLMEHRHRRLIYAAPLWEGARDWLTERSLAVPSYVSAPSRFPDATQRIIDYWRRRWLAVRLDHSSPGAEPHASNHPSPTGEMARMEEALAS